MKISNFFKKETKAAESSVQKLEKKQLEKVIGGTDTVKTTVVVKGTTVKGNVEIQ